MKRLKPIDVHSLKKGDVFYIKNELNDIEKWKVTEICRSASTNSFYGVKAICLNTEGIKKPFHTYRKNEEYFISVLYLNDPRKIIAVKKKGKHNLY